MQFIEQAEKKIQEDLASNDPVRIETANQMLAKVQQVKQHISQPASTGNLQPNSTNIPLTNSTINIPSTTSSTNTPFNGMEFMQNLNQNNPWQGLRPMASVQRDDQTNQYKQALENEQNQAKIKAIADALASIGKVDVGGKLIDTLDGKYKQSMITENQAQATKALKPTGGGGSRGLTAYQQYNIANGKVKDQAKLRKDAIDYLTKLNPGGFDTKGNKKNNFAKMSSGKQEQLISQYIALQNGQPQTTNTPVQTSTTGSTSKKYSPDELNKIIDSK